MILDHDGFRFDEEKAATPSAPAALLLFGHPVDPAVASATRRAYLDVADDYVGSPMLSSLLGVFAAHEGDRRRSSALFEEGYGKFCSDRFANVHEYRPDRFPDEPVAGPFYANLSGFLLALHVRARATSAWALGRRRRGAVRARLSCRRCGKAWRWNGCGPTGAAPPRRLPRRRAGPHRTVGLSELRRRVGDGRDGVRPRRDQHHGGAGPSEGPGWTSAESRRRPEEVERWRRRSRSRRRSAT